MRIESGSTLRTPPAARRGVLAEAVASEGGLNGLEHPRARRVGVLVRVQLHDVGVVQLLAGDVPGHAADGRADGVGGRHGRAGSWRARAATASSASWAAEDRTPSFSWTNARRCGTLSAVPTSLSIFSAGPCFRKSACGPRCGIRYGSTAGPIAASAFWATS